MSKKGMTEEEERDYGDNNELFENKGEGDEIVVEGNAQFRNVHIKQREGEEEEKGQEDDETIA